jgi:hypothetical protein
VLNAALGQIAHPQLLGDLLGGHGLALVSEAGGAGGDNKYRQFVTTP